MKKLTAALVLFGAGPAFAHGLHAPVPDAAHGLAHAAPVAVGVVAIALAIWLWRTRA